MNRKNPGLRIFFVIVIMLKFIALEPLQVLAIDSLYQPAQERGRAARRIQLKDRAQGRKFVPGQIIVKLKEGAGLNDIQELNQACGVISAEQAFPPAPNPERTLQELKEELAQLSSEHERWFWQLDKDSLEYKQYMQKTERRRQALQARIKAQEDFSRHLKIRQARAPKGAKKPSLDNIYLLTIKGEKDIHSAIARYKLNPNVEYAGPNYLLKVELSGGSGNLIFSGEQKSFVAGAAKAILAVVDTGVNPDLLNGYLWRNEAEIPDNGRDDDNNGYTDDLWGWNFTLDNNEPNDYLGHGTNVAKYAVEFFEKYQGALNPLPKIEIMPLRAVVDGQVTEIAIARAIKYAADNGADVINNSYALKFIDPGKYAIPQEAFDRLKEAFDYAYAQGCVIVAGAGNATEGNAPSDVATYLPARFPEVIAVSGSDENGNRSEISNWGEKIEFTAASAGIPTTATSFAAALVSAAAALLAAKNQNLSNSVIRQIMRYTADDIGAPGKDIYFGYGRVNPQKALALDLDFYVELPQFVRGNIQLSGSAYLSENLRGNYELYLIPEAEGSSQKTIFLANSPASLKDNILGSWNTLDQQTPDGSYRLVAVLNGRDGSHFADVLDLTVDNQSQPPEFISPAAAIAVIGRPFVFEIKAVDPDDPSTPQGRLTYSLSNHPPGAVFDSRTRTLSWLPGEQDKGNYRLKFTVQDNEHNVTQDFTLATVYIKKEQLLDYEIYDYDISGDKIIWTNNSGDIYLYDLLLLDPAARKVKLWDGSGSPKYPLRLQGNNLAWQENSQLHLYNILSLEHNSLSPVSGGILFDFDLNDRYLVFTERTLPIKEEEKFKFAYYGYYLFNLRDKSTIPIEMAPARNSISLMKLNRDGIAWSDGRNGNTGDFDVYLYKLGSGEKIQLTDNPEVNEIVESSFGDKIVWTTSSRYFFDFLLNKESRFFYLYDTSSGEKKKVILAPGFYVDYSISGDKISCLDWDDYSVDIYSTELGAGFTIDAPPAGSDYALYNYDRAKIFEDRVFWLEYRWPNPYRYISMAELFFAPQIAAADKDNVAADPVITISGKNFGYRQGKDSKVIFANGASGLVQDWSNTRITCIAPESAKSLALKVVTPGGESNSVTVYGSLPGVEQISAYDAALALVQGRGALEAAGIAQHAVGL